MSKYTDIFFDLDRTLWDFDRNSSETLSELYAMHQLEKELGVELDVFLSAFREINAQEWRDFRLGDQTKDDMRNNRFVNTFFKFGNQNWKKARILSQEYIEICPYKPNLVEGTEDLLEELITNYNIHIITNGFSDSQRIKIESSGLNNYISELIISEETAFRKPQREIFLEAVKRAQTSLKDSIMIGDDWQKDIQGAKRAGMDQVFFNPSNEGVRNEGSCTFEVQKLSEILEKLDLKK